MSTLITLTYHVNHEKMLSCIFLTSNSRENKNASEHEAVASSVCIHCLSVCIYIWVPVCFGCGSTVL